MNNTVYEVEIELHAADIEIKITRLSKNNWKFSIHGIEVKNGRESNAFGYRILTDAQVAATLALFIGDDAIKNEDVVKHLYEVAEQVWKDAPQHFRIIP